MSANAGGIIYRDGALAAAATLVSNGATYVLYVAAAHALGPERGGSFLAIVAAMLLLSTIASVFGTSITLDVATLCARATENEIGALVRATFRWWFIASLLVALIVAVFHAALDAFFHIENGSVVFLAMLALASNALLLLIRAVVQGLNAFRTLLQSSGIEAALKLAASAAIFAVPTLPVAIGGLAAALCCAAALSLLYIRTFLARRATDRRERVPLLGSPALVGALAGLSVMTFADGIVARHFLPVRESGLYNAVALGGRALITVLAFLPSLVLSRVGRQQPGDRSLAVPIFGTVAVAGSLAIALFAAFPRLIIAVVAGPAFEPGASLVAPYGVAAAALAMTTVIASYRIARGARWIGSAVVVIAIAETAALLTYHSSAAGLVRVIIAGHLTALAATSARSIKNPFRRTVVAS